MTTMTRDLFAPTDYEQFELAMRQSADQAYDWTTFCIHWSKELVDAVQHNLLTKDQGHCLWSIKKILENEICARRESEDRY